MPTVQETVRGDGRALPPDRSGTNATIQYD